jgi:hypothetical protein
VTLESKCLQDSSSPWKLYLFSPAALTRCYTLQDSTVPKLLSNGSGSEVRSPFPWAEAKLSTGSLPSGRVCCLLPSGLGHTTLTVWTGDFRTVQLAAWTEGCPVGCGLRLSASTELHRPWPLGAEAGLRELPQPPWPPQSSEHFPSLSPLSPTPHLSIDLFPIELPLPIHMSGQSTLCKGTPERQIPQEPRSYNPKHTKSHPSSRPAMPTPWASGLCLTTVCGLQDGLLELSLSDFATFKTILKEEVQF